MSGIRLAYFIKTGYVLLDYVEPTTGQILSVTWNEHREDATKRRNLFRGISRLILSIARIPQPRIGSFKFQDDGTITLTNRPLTCGMMILENDGAPRVIEKEETYTCIEPYVSDLLTLHEGRFLAQPNAVNHERDCHFQMAVQALLRTISHHYYDRGMRYGPFVMQFTDLHASNLLVDSDWNITSIIDLEWICARPPEMLDVPYWITGLGIDEVGEEEHSEDYARAREEFMAIFEDEERGLALNDRSALRISEIMRRTYESGGSWFAHCLDSVNGMFALFDQHPRPRFISFYLSERVEILLSRFWTGDSEEVVTRKLKEKDEYAEELRTLFKIDTGAGDGTGSIVDDIEVAASTGNSTTEGQGGCNPSPLRRKPSSRQTSISPPSSVPLPCRPTTGQPVDP